MELVMQPLLLVLLNILRQKSFRYLHQEAISSPLFQSKFYRHPSCTIFLAVGNTQCTHCNKAETKENKGLKKKDSNLSIPAKLHAPIKHTAPERIKLTLQNIHLENKSLKSEIEQMKNEIENK